MKFTSNRSIKGLALDRFKDRKDAGQKLALLLKEYTQQKETILIGLPRGGVIVAAEIAKALGLPLDIICPRKIGAPFNPEYAIGAITETGEGFFNEEVVKELGIEKRELSSLIEKEKKEAERRLKFYRKGKPARNLQNKRVILIDDGLATGSTMFAAIRTAKKENAKEIVVAIPVSPPDTFSRIELEVFKAICLLKPSDFYAVGQFYENFDPVEDDEVIFALSKENSFH